MRDSAQMRSELQSFFNPRNLICLRPLRTLNNVELYFVSLFQTLVTIELNGGVMHKDIRAILTTEKPVSFGIVEPLYRAFVLCHVYPRANRSRRGKCFGVVNSDAGAMDLVC